MTRSIHIAAAILFSFSGAIAAAENSAIAGAGLSLAGVEVPAAGAPKNNQWQTLKKIKLNTAAPEMNDKLVGLLDRGFDSYTAVRELTQAGFKVQAYQSNTGGYMVFADVTGEDAADRAVGLARYYYITEVRVGQKVFDQLFGPATRTKSSYAVKMGTIKGGMNGAPVDLRINKLEWTIKGGINGAPVDLEINHDQSVITGGANASTVGLRFDWSPEAVTVKGAAGHDLVDYTVNWKNGLLEGRHDNSPIRLKFDMKEAVAGDTRVFIDGYANGEPVELEFDKTSGKLAGAMNDARVDVTLVNCDLYDFLQYFFLFLK